MQQTAKSFEPNRARRARKALQATAKTILTNHSTTNNININRFIFSLNKKQIIIPAIVAIFVIGIFFMSQEKKPDVKFTDNQKFSENISIEIPKRLEFNVINNENATYSDVKVIVDIENTNDLFLSIQPKETIIEPLLGIDDSSPRKTITFTLHDIAEGSQITYNGKLSLLVNGVETDKKDIELRASK